MMKSENNYDVLIIGGGPAGSSAATFLAKKGFSVLVLEKEIFPRDHVGESLIPFCYGKMEKLGVLDKMTKIAVRKPGVNFVSADGQRETTWCFRSTLKDKSQLSFHMLRSTFDKMLLDHSRESGAAVMEGCKVLQADLSNPESVSIEAVSDDGSRHTFTARFLLDASGQSTFLASKTGTKTPYEGLDRVAFFSHWSGNTYDKSLNEGLIKIVYLGGEKNGWCWIIPVGKDLLSIGVTLNNAYVREKKKEYAAHGEEWKTRFYEDEILQSPVIQQILKQAGRTHDVIVLGDYSYRTSTRYGSNYALIGDAAAFLDPIFSSGVYVAFESADLVSAAVETLLRKDAGSGNEQLRAAYAHMDGAYRLLERFIRLFYSPETWDFSTLGSPEVLLFHKFEAAYTIFHNLLAGDFFTNYEKYIEFIDELHRRKLMNKYVHFSNSHSMDFGTGSCGEKHEDVYGQMDESLLDLPKAVH